MPRDEDPARFEPLVKLGQKGLQVLAHVERRVVAVGRPLRQRLETDPLELLGDRIVDLPGRARLEHPDPLQDLRGARTAEGAGRSQQFVEHHPQAENIGPAIDQMPFAAGLLGAHVDRRARPFPALAEIFFPQGKAEVGEVRPELAIDEDIGRLHVPMHDAVQMGMMQGFGHRRHKLHGLAARQRRILVPRLQVAALDEPGDDIAHAVLRQARIMHGHDGRMFEPGQDPGFFQVDFRRVQEVAMGDLDGDRSLQHAVVATIDPAKGPAAQNRFHTIAADLDRALFGTFDHQRGRGRRPARRRGGGVRLPIGRSQLQIGIQRPFAIGWQAGT